VASTRRATSSAAAFVLQSGSPTAARQSSSFIAASRERKRRHQFSLGGCIASQRVKSAHSVQNHIAAKRAQRRRRAAESCRLERIGEPRRIEGAVFDEEAAGARITSGFCFECS
jgi:hypothetical protein